MADWMDQEIEREQRAREAQRKASEENDRVTKLIMEKGRGVLDSLTAAVGNQIGIYQQKTAGVKSRQVTFNANPSGGFSVDKPIFPATNLRCRLYEDGVIRATSSHLPNRDALRRDEYITLPLAVVGDDVEILIDGRPTAVDEVATYLLKPALFPRD